MIRTGRAAPDCRSGCPVTACRRAGRFLPLAWPSAFGKPVSRRRGRPPIRDPARRPGRPRDVPAGGPGNVPSRSVDPRRGPRPARCHAPADRSAAGRHSANAKSRGPAAAAAELAGLRAEADRTAVKDRAARRGLFDKVCHVRRRIALSNPLLAFKDLLFVKRQRARSITCAISITASASARAAACSFSPMRLAPKRNFATFWPRPWWAAAGCKGKN